jgi:hypothetical protein
VAKPNTQRELSAANAQYIFFGRIGPHAQAGTRPTTPADQT